MHTHDILGGRYINLLFQSKQLGLTDKWLEIKRNYAGTNIVLEDIPKVTPSSKVMGDLAQFMVHQDLSLDDVSDRAEELVFPESVAQYLRGKIGAPPEDSPNCYHPRF